MFICTWRHLTGKLTEISLISVPPGDRSRKLCRLLLVVSGSRLGRLTRWNENELFWVPVSSNIWTKELFLFERPQGTFLRRPGEYEEKKCSGRQEKASEANQNLGELFWKVSNEWGTNSRVWDSGEMWRLMGDGLVNSSYWLAARQVFSFFHSQYKYSWEYLFVSSMPNIGLATKGGIGNNTITAAGRSNSSERLKPRPPFHCLNLNITINVPTVLNVPTALFPLQHPCVRQTSAAMDSGSRRWLLPRVQVSASSPFYCNSYTFHINFLFRFEYLWPFWLLVRSIYDSFKYQGLVRIHYTEQNYNSNNIFPCRLFQYSSSALL